MQQPSPKRKFVQDGPDAEDRKSIGYLLTAHRDKKAALRFFKKAVGRHGLPDKAEIGKSGANTAAIEAL